MLLEQDQIKTIHRAALEAGLSRQVLLSGLGASFASSLPEAPNPGGQFLSDLNHLNQTGQLEDGSVPLVQWLRQAELLAGPRMQAKVFREALEILQSASAKAPITDPPPQITIINTGQMAGVAIGTGAQSQTGSVHQTSHSTPPQPNNTSGSPQKDPAGADVLIICALKDELDAVLNVEQGALGEEWSKHKDKAGFTYHTRCFDTPNRGELTVAVTQAASMGGNATTAAAIRLVSELNPRCLAMCGICAGKRGDVSLGDVIVADRVFDYDYGKLKVHTNPDGNRQEDIFHDITTYNLSAQWKLAAEHFPTDWSQEFVQTRPLTYRAQGRWLLHALFDMEPGTERELLKWPEFAQYCPERKKVIARLRKQNLLASKGLALTDKGRELVDEEQLVGEELEDKPFTVHIGPIAAGSKVVQDPEIFGRLEGLGRKTIGLEMEGASIGFVAHLEGIKHHIVAKAVVDHADLDKDDQFRVFASKASAQFLLAFLREHLPANPQRARSLKGTASSQPPALLLGDPSIGIPPARNLFFEGRQTLLEQLYETLNTKERAALTQAAIAGLGGIGKTSLAAEYAHRYKDEYELMWWLHAQEPTTLASEFAQLAVELHRKGKLPKQVLDLKVPEQVNASKRWLMEHEGWLLVFDNVGSPDDLKPYLLSEHRGHVIVTSRNPNWDEYIQGVFIVPTMERDESVASLLKRTKLQDKQAAVELAGELGDLPLALAQAAAYIRECRISIAEYLELFQEKRQELALLTEPGPPRNYPDTVATTWSLSLEKLSESVPLAIDLLRLMAFLAPQNIPLSLLLQEGQEHLPKELAKAAKDRGALMKARRALRQYSLVEVDEDQKSLSVHRLVQAVVRDDLDGRCWSAVALKVVGATFPKNASEHGMWQQAARLLEHARAVIRWSKIQEVAPAVRSSLLVGAGSYLQARGQYEQARSLLERALVLNCECRGMEHPSTLVSMSNLALVFQNQGHLEEAKRLQEKEFELSHKLLGEENPNTLVSMNNLALTLHALGDLERAEFLLRKALEIGHRVQGEEHPSTLVSMNNLTSVLKAQGDFSRAREFNEKVLESWRRIEGEKHPETLRSMINLAHTLWSMDDLKGARTLNEKALEEGCQILGEAHPDVLNAMNNLASVLWSQGDQNGARALHEKVLEGWSRVLGEEHPRTLVSMANLAHTLWSMDDLEGAKLLFQKVLKGQRKVLGPRHEDTTLSTWSLVLVLQGLGASPNEVLPLLRGLLWLLKVQESQLSAAQRQIRETLARQIGEQLQDQLKI